MLGNFLQQATPEDVIFQMHFFLGALRVSLQYSRCKHQMASSLFSKKKRMTPSSAEQEFIFSAFLLSADFFKIHFFEKKNSGIRSACQNSLDPDFARHSIGPYLAKVISARLYIHYWHITCRLSMS